MDTESSTCTQIWVRAVHTKKGQAQTSLDLLKVMSCLQFCYILYTDDCRSNHQDRYLVKFADSSALLERNIYQIQKEDFFNIFFSILLFQEKQPLRTVALSDILDARQAGG